MKIAIIGGGICGLCLAAKLAQKKHAVTVFEAKRTVGKECCSGLFSARLFEFVPEAKALSTNRIDRAIINFPKKSINLKFKQPFYVIEHAQLDLLAAALASQAGADIRLGETINAARLAEFEKTYDRVIGCDGALSPTRSYLYGELQTRRSKTSAKSQMSCFCDKLKLEFYLGIQGFEKKPDNSDFVETWATKNGFLWKIPRGIDVEWGIMEKPDAARRVFNEFIDQRGLGLENLKSAIIPQGLVIPRNERITLCGDASGLTKPWSGGGVIWNLTQAGFLLKNFPDFLQYKEEADRFFSFRIGLGKRAKTLAYAAGFNFPWAIPANVGLDGDYLTKK